MTTKLRFILSMSFFSMLLSLTVSRAQTADLLIKTEPSQRVKIAPESVFKMFREAGLKPVNRTLTTAEKEKVSKAFEHLTPLHQRILKQHLLSISFMDNMPNTALTSQLDTSGACWKKTFLNGRPGKRIPASPLLPIPVISSALKAAVWMRLFMCSCTRPRTLWMQ